MVRVFGSVVAIASFGVASMGACSDNGGRSAPDSGGSNGSGAGSPTGSGGATAGTSAGGGSAGETTVPPACPQCESGLCLETGECVECLSDPETCEDGYCGSGNTCVPGCNGGNACASGECVAQNCERCVDDSECSEGRVCGSGICAAPCTGASDCDMTCCSARCVDTRRDVANCGGCGVACSASEFCGSSGCTAAVLSKLCENTDVALILNGFATDDAGAARMKTAIETDCSPAPSVRSVSQATTDLINPATGQPLGGGALLVLAGGGFGHKHVGWLEQERTAPIYSTLADGNMLEFRESGSDNVVMSAPYASVSDTHDFFVVQMARDEKTGTASVLAYGFFDAGTRAAAFYFAEVLMPSLSSYTAPWYVFEWTDANRDKVPSANEITMADSG